MTGPDPTRPAPGFTLIEMLVAVAVFAIISAVMFVALNEILNDAAASRRALDRLADIQRTFTIMANDFNQAAPRPARDRFGDIEPAMVSDQGVLRFTRAGYRNLRDEPRSTLRRVGYALGAGSDEDDAKNDEQDTLLRYTWTRVDQPIEPQPATQTMLDGVTGLRVRYRYQGEWLDDWPPLVPDGRPPALPRAVSIQLDLTDYGPVNRTFALP